MDDQQEPLLGSRRGMSFSARVRAPDSYGLLLAMILLTMIVAAGAGEWSVGRVVTILLLIGTLVFALRTSRVEPTTMRSALLLLAVGGSAAIVGAALASVDVQRTIVGAVSAVLILAALVAVLRRLVSHPVVSGKTILGALCIYLLIGLVFAAVFSLVDGAGSFFSIHDASMVDYLYFSFVTLTTVGYGDLTAVGDLPRMLAVTEALIGQLYLVSVVALVVGNLGKGRNTSSD